MDISKILKSIKSHVKEDRTIKPNARFMVDFHVNKEKVHSLVIDTSGPIDVYLMDQANAGLYLENLPFSSPLKWKGITRIDHAMKMDSIGSLFGIKVNVDHHGVHVYLILENNGVEAVNTTIKYNP
ncbi:MAG: hypothetical protein ACFFCS_05245 [Candidatus Hodarchaeota archaeon]